MSNLINLPTYEQQQEMLEKINQGYLEKLRGNTENGLIQTSISLSPTTATDNVVLDIEGKGELIEIFCTHTYKYPGSSSTMLHFIAIVDGGTPLVFETKTLYQTSSSTSVVVNDGIAISPMFTRDKNETLVESLLTGNTASFNTLQLYSPSNYIGGLPLPIKFNNSLKIIIKGTKADPGPTIGKIAYILN